MSELKRKQVSYEAGFKLKVVEYAELHGNSNAMQEYDELFGESMMMKSLKDFKLLFVCLRLNLLISI